FQTPQSYNVGSPPFIAPISVAVGDLNGDGIPDLALANGFNSTTVSILLGNGDGTFGVPQRYDAGDSPVWVAMGDFNADCQLDPAVASAATFPGFNEGPGKVNVLLGNGDGSSSHPEPMQPASARTVNSSL